jgi:hypothetical protein
MDMQPWDSYRDVMAEALDAASWGAVSQSAIELQALSEGMRKAPTIDPTAPRQITRGAAASMLNIRTNAIQAFNVLGELADDNEKLSPSDPPEIGETATTG